MINKRKYTKRYLGYLKTNDTQEVFKITDISFTANELILSTKVKLAS